MGSADEGAVAVGTTLDMVLVWADAEMEADAETEADVEAETSPACAGGGGEGGGELLGKDKDLAERKLSRLGRGATMASRMGSRSEGVVRSARRGGAVGGGGG